MRVPGGQLIAKIGKVVGFLLAVLFTKISLVFADHKIPEPTGSNAVSTTSFEWVDESRHESFSKNRDDKRSLLVQVWYPTEKTDEELEQIDTVPNLPLAKAVQIYPVLVFSHGYGTRLDQYKLQMKELASHGYVIFCIAHPYESEVVVYPNGRVVNMQVINSLQSKEQLIVQMLEQYRTATNPETKNQLLRQYDTLMGEIFQNSLKIWVEDTIFVINQIEQLNNGKISSRFAEHLDLEHMGIFGHSFGGAVAAKVCLLDNRVKAGINMDGFQVGQFNDFQNHFMQQPFMLMNSDSTPGMNDFMYQRINNWAYRVVINGAKHKDFTDIPITDPALNTALNKVTGQPSTIAPERAMKITNSYLLSFFNKYLRCVDSLLQDQVFPEVDFQVRKAN